MDPVISFTERSKHESENLSSADLLDMKNRLDDELRSLLVALSTATQESSPAELEDLQQRVQDLQEQLVKESNKTSVNELFLKRIQLGKTLCDSMFSEGAVSDANPFTKRSLEELELASQIKRIHTETSELQEKCERIKFANSQLRKENMEMMQALKQKKKANTISAEVTSSKNYKRLKVELEKNIMSLDILRNVIQLVVTGMGKDWSQDPELGAVMTKCGEPLNL